jgi:hypothetical protein
MDVIRRFNLLMGCLILVSLTVTCKRSEKEPANKQTSKTSAETEKYVFPTTDLKHYRFPTQVIDNDLSEWEETGKNPDGTKNKFNTAYKGMP